jgi:UDP-N-acetylglucosamine 2-epimerase (non-hydrolysing)
MSPIIRELEKREIDFFILHTGQHYDYEMDGAFFDELKLPKPKYNLGVGSGSQAEQTGRILISVEGLLVKERPDVILVQGDTNTVLAGALAGSKLGVKVGHVEAGLRSYDKSMSEEINRVITDHISDYLFAPTTTAKQNLEREGIAENKILVTGNTIVDAVNQNLELSRKKSKVLKSFNLENGNFFLVTAHRAENVDSKTNFTGIINGLKAIRKEYNIPVILPLHPRSLKMVKEFNLDISGLMVITPMNYLDFLSLESNAKVILTDSGGVQEESCILGVPCVTLREKTERPETVEVGANRIVGTSVERIIDGVRDAVSNQKKWLNPFGDGHAGELIITYLRELMSRQKHN